MWYNYNYQKILDGECEQMLEHRDGIHPSMQTKQQQQIYAVTAKHAQGPVFIGLAQGELEDIKAYFDNQKGYGLEISPANPINVECGFAKKREQLLIRENQLRAELEQIQRELHG